MKASNKTIFSFLLVGALSLSLIISQANFVHAEKKEASNTTSKTLNTKSDQLAALNKKAKRLVNQIKASKSKAAKKKLKQKLALIEQQIQALSKANDLTPDSAKPIPQPILKPTPIATPPLSAPQNQQPLEMISNSDVQITTGNGPPTNVIVMSLDLESLPSPINSNSTIYILADISPTPNTPQTESSYTITISLPDSVIKNGSDLKLLHYENNNWVDITTSVDLINKTITGKCNNFSPFAVTSSAPVVGNCGATTGSTSLACSLGTCDPTKNQNCFVAPLGATPSQSCACAECPAGCVLLDTTMFFMCNASKPNKVNGTWVGVTSTIEPFPECCCPNPPPPPVFRECTTTAQCNNNCGVCTSSSGIVPFGSLAGINIGLGLCELNPIPGTLLSKWIDGMGYGRYLPEKSKYNSTSIPAAYDGNKINDYFNIISLMGLPSTRNAPVCPSSKYDENNCTCNCTSQSDCDEGYCGTDGKCRRDCVFDHNHCNTNPKGHFCKFNQCGCETNADCAGLGGMCYLKYPAWGSCFECDSTSTDPLHVCSTGKVCNDAVKMCECPLPYVLNPLRPGPGNCPANNVPNAANHDCCFACPAGYTPNALRPGPGNCPANSVPSDATHNCCFACPAPYIPNTLRPGPGNCPANNVPSDATENCCLACPAGYTPNPARPGPGNCPANSFPNDATHNCCFACPAPYTPNPARPGPGNCPANNVPNAANHDCCFACPAGYTPNPARPGPGNCPVGNVPSDATHNCCFACPASYTPNPLRPGIGNCPAGNVPSDVTHNCCFACPAGYTPNALRPGIGNCPAGNVPSDVTHNCCFACPAGYTPNPVRPGPGNCPVNNVPNDATHNCCFACPAGSTPNPLRPGPGNCPVTKVPSDATHNCCSPCPTGYTPNPLRPGPGNCPSDSAPPANGNHDCCFNTNCSSYLVNNTDAIQCMTKTAPPTDSKVHTLTCVGAGAGKFCTVSGPVNASSTCACLFPVCGDNMIEGTETCDGTMLGPCTGVNESCNATCMGCNCAVGFSDCSGMCCANGQCANGMCCTTIGQTNCSTPQGDVCCASGNCLPLFSPANTGQTACCTPPQIVCGAGVTAKCCGVGTTCINATSTCCDNNKICGPTNNLCCGATETCIAMACVTLCAQRDIAFCPNPGGCPPGETCVTDLAIGAPTPCRCQGPVACGNGTIDGLLTRTIDPTHKHNLKKHNKKHNKKQNKKQTTLKNLATIGEQCDDWNTVSGDGCSAGCQTEYCGDGWCNNSETCSSCSSDCGSCPITCGNLICDGTETCSSCPGDCGICTADCGDGVISPGEDCEPPDTLRCDSNCKTIQCGP